MNDKLKGKVVIAAGVSSGIVKATSREFERHGIRIIPAVHILWFQFLSHFL
jgi:NADP-dependent 3-hydroxy acid dehydrogenase YdfG